MPEGKVHEVLVRIEQVRVRNFRGIYDCTLTLRPTVTLLVGQNSAGKSRLLRAIALACGAISANLDDFTVNGAEEPTIDLVLAPSSTEPHATFDDRIRAIFGNHVQVVSLVTGSERVCWRTTILRSNEGWGGKVEAKFLTFNGAKNDWIVPATPNSVGREHRRVLTADMVETGRDLAAEMSRQGTSIRRVLDQLEIPESDRASLEKSLKKLGKGIVEKSATLAAIQNRLQTLDSLMSGVGAPQVNALPGRLEELVRMIEIALDTGGGGLPMRMHGSGARSLTSMQVQSVLYDRKIGRDGTSVPTHPITLIEEPESHLHPQACLELEGLLRSIPGQVVASSHSSHLVTAVESESLRLIQRNNGKTIVRDFTPTDQVQTIPPTDRINLTQVDWEKMKRFVERPFGEILFASGIIIGDGASERGFLPHIIRHALGADASGICVVDPGSLSQAKPIIDYAEAVQIPCILFVDCDDGGRKDEKNMPSYARRIWSTGDKDTDGALEEILVEHNQDWVLETCRDLLPSVDGTALERLKKLKGSYGSPLGKDFVRRFSTVADWPIGFRNLIDSLPSSKSQGGN